MAPQGLRMLKRGGCLAIAQDEASCVVFGMPKEAIQAGVVDTVVPLSRLAAAIVTVPSRGAGMIGCCPKNGRIVAQYIHSCAPSRSIESKGYLIEGRLAA